MPFKKVGKDDYVSPSGRHYNQAQVRLWYAKGGKFPGEKGPGELSGNMHSKKSSSEGRKRSKPWVSGSGKSRRSGAS